MNGKLMIGTLAVTLLAGVGIVAAALYKKTKTRRYIGKHHCE